MVALRGENRGVSPLISTLFMILVTVVVGMTLVVGALTFLPDSTATRPQADFVIEDHTVEVNTACGLSGVASRFAYAQVNARRVPLSDQEYAFTLSIDPDGPNSVGGART